MFYKTVCTVQEKLSGNIVLYHGKLLEKWEEIDVTMTRIKNRTVILQNLQRGIGKLVERALFEGQCKYGGKNMAKEKYSKKNAYKVINHLMEGYRDFIVIGLCGKTGSGVTTIADILTKKFDDLQMPVPGFSGNDLYKEHEYRIAYTYAKKNWEPMHRVKTSALITRKIMNEDKEKFGSFMGSLVKGIDENKCKKCAEEFFQAKIEFDLKDECGKYFGEIKGKESLAYIKLSRDEEFEKISIDEESENNDISKKCTCKLSDDIKISFLYNKETASAIFTNYELSKLMDYYAELRKKKGGLKNQLLYLLLRKYVYESLPQITKEFWKKISALKHGANTIALQCIGNNLRIWKKPYMNVQEMDFEVQEDGYTIIAEEINLAIKILRATQYCSLNKEDEEKKHPVQTIVVVDSIKNPYESLYLKRRYNNYFLIGVYTEDEERRSRLREGNAKYPDNEIDAIDTIEDASELEKSINNNEKSESEEKNEFLDNIIRYLCEEFSKSKLIDILPFVSQNIRDCLESADIFINNVKDDSAYINLKHILLRYVSLIMNPGLLLPTHVERCMQIAYTAKLNSGCISRQVGAVITDKKYHLFSIGWNQQPEMELPCSYRDLCELRHHWSPLSYSDFENDNNDKFQKNITESVEKVFDNSKNPLSENGKLPCFCFKDIYNTITGEKNQVHPRSLHAEETAFMNLGKNGIQLLEGGILFTTSSPCELCSKKAMYMGIRKIYYAQVYSGISYPHVLSAGPKEKRPDVILFTGAIGEAYTKLFTPAIPHKDENKMWCGGKIEQLSITEKEECGNEQETIENEDEG